MKQIFRVFVALLTILSFGCSTAPTRDLKKGERIQVIELDAKVHVYAQDDVVLNQDSMHAGVSSLKPEFAEQLDAASFNRAVGTGAYFIQLTTLGLCIGLSYVSAIPWCLASLGAGGAAIPLTIRANRQENEVIRAYNEQLQMVAK